MAQQGNIAQYTSPVDELHPQSQGAEALASAGVHEGRLYHQAAEDYQQAGNKLGGIITQHEVMSEVSQGSAALAAMHNNFTTQWNEMASKSDPNDASIQGKFLDNVVEPQLQKFQDGFTTEKGQEWAMRQADDMRLHYNEKTAADMSQRAGTARIEDFKTTLNQLSDAARKDPSSMDFSLGQVDALLEATKEHNTGMLTPEQIDHLSLVAHDMKGEIVKSGLQGIADVNPKGAIAAINSGHFSNYITGTEGDTLTKYAEGITRMKLEDQSRAYEQQQRAQKVQEEATANKLLNTIYNPDTGQISIPNNINQQIFGDTTLSAKSKVELMGVVKHVSQETSMDDPTSVRGLYAGLAPDSPNPTTQATALSMLGAGKITPQTYAEVNSIIKGSDSGKINADGFTQTLKVIKTQVSGEDQLPGIKDPKGEENYAKALPAINKALQAGLAAGIPESELYNPASKDWIGNAAKQFIRPSSQWYTDLTAANLLGSGAATGKTNLDSKYTEDFKAGKLDINALKADYKKGNVSEQTARELAIASGHVSAGNTPVVPKAE